MTLLFLDGESTPWTREMAQCQHSVTSASCRLNCLGCYKLDKLAKYYYANTYAWEVCAYLLINKDIANYLITLPWETSVFHVVKTFYQVTT